jgi:hypothetical protein
LREYSIPHLRRSGRISIPEESFDRIREARDLHKEGLGTESVRRMLREGSSPGAGELTQRLDHLHETLENLHGSAPERPTTSEVAVPSPTLRTILARQSLLISAVFNLTEMVEELLLASGKPRKVVFGDVEDEIRTRASLTEQTESQRLQTPVEIPATTRSAPTARPRSRDTPVRREGFGSLRQRRRRGALAMLSILVVGALLAWALPGLSGERASDLSFLGGRQAEDSQGVQAGGSQGTENEDDAAPEEKVEPQNPPADEGAAGITAGSRSGGSERTGQVEIPDVSNREVEDATRILSQAGLTVAAAKNEASPQEIGTLLGTEPAAGSTVEPGSRVTLVLSGGPDWAPPGTRSAASGNGPATPQYGN